MGRSGNESRAGAQQRKIAKRRLLLQVDAATQIGDATRAAADFLKGFRRGRSSARYEREVNRMTPRQAEGVCGNGATG